MAVNTIITWVNTNFCFGKQKQKNATFILKVAFSIIYKYVSLCFGNFLLDVSQECF